MNDLNNEHFIKVIRFIYDHIDQPIMLDDLAELIGRILDLEIIQDN